jgi:hypothetical protein
VQLITLNILHETDRHSPRKPFDQKTLNVLEKKMNQTVNYPDALAERTLRALAPHMGPSWIEMKRRSLAGKDRLDVLDWIACCLDGTNKAIVADEFGLDVADLQSLQRVMQKTRWA